jgi:hypothetical protein
MDSATDLPQMLDFVEQHRPVDVDGVKHVIMGVDSRYVSLDGLNLVPTRSRGTVDAASNADFARLVSALDPLYSSRVYYTPRGSFCCILNDDIASDEDGHFLPDWRDYRITYAPKVDDAWAAWMRTFGDVDSVKPTWISQLAFAEFVQERMQDFKTPAGLAMLELAQKFDLHRSGKFVQALRLDNGDTTLSVQEESKPGAGITIPAKLVLGMRVFEDQAQGYSFSAYFRYRLVEGQKLVVSVMIEDKPIIQRRAVDDMVKETQALLPKTSFYKVAAFPAATAPLSAG